MTCNQAGIIGVLVIAACAAPVANADPITYTIDFSEPSSIVAFGDLPTAGSFTYDPGTQTFSDFTVTWDGTTLDLTDGANDPYIPGTDLSPCLDGSTGASAAFLFLTACTQPVDAGNPTWLVNCCTDGEPIIDLGYNSYEGLIGIDSDPLVTDTGSRVAQGDFSVSESPATPEPATLLLLGTGLAGIARRLRRR